VLYLDQVESTEEGVEIGRIREEGVITLPSALALDRGAGHRAKHWLCSKYMGKGCKGKGVMMKGIK
jgi:hypothetical protein